MLTDLTPTDHGIVGNGWYFRDLGEIFRVAATGVRDLLLDLSGVREGTRA